MVDARFADQSRVKLGDPVTLRGGGGLRGARQGEDARLSVLGGPTGLLDPTVADLSSVARGMDQRLDGILGDDFLHRFVLELDYRDSRVLFQAPGAATPPADAAPMRVAHTPFVLAKVRQGRREVQAEFQIDTGSNTAVEFWRPFARAAFPGAQGLQGEGLGVAGGTTIRQTRLDLLSVAGQKIVGPIANLDDDVRPDDASGAYGGVIGGPAWSGLAITLDFPRGRFWAR